MAEKRIRTKLDPTAREIIRVMQPLRLAVSPAKIARTINVHPKTVQNRLKWLDSRGVTKCDWGGRKKMTRCRLDPKWKSNLKKLR